MASKRVKRDCRGGVENKHNTATEDRLSQLPDPLIYYIFSFLPTFYIVQMSILSKRWRRMWVSTPFIYLEDFCGINKKAKNRKRFLKFVSRYLTCRELYKQVPETSITRFEFDSSYSFENTCRRLVKGWFKFLIERNVKELDLHLKYYRLPQFVLNATSLTVLELNDMTLETPSLSILPSLKVLSLIDVSFDAKSLQDVISGCPIIEDLHVDGRCTGGHVDFSVSKTLKYLLLSDLTFSCQWLEGLIYGLPFLERLSLYSCNGFKNVSICSHSLKSLHYKDEWTDGWKATLRTPNLVCMSLFCRAKSIISIVEASDLFELHLKLRNYYCCVLSYDDTVHFLANFNSLKKMKLCIREQEIIFPRNIRNTCSPPLPNLKHLKLKIPYELRRKSELEESVHWCAPSLETLEIDEKQYCEF